MKKLVLSFLLLTGCVVETEPEVLLEDEVAEVQTPTPESIPEDGTTGPDLCAPFVKEVTINGESIFIEIPAECHPVEPLDTEWGDDYTEGQGIDLPEVSQNETEQH